MNVNQTRHRVLAITIFAALLASGINLSAQGLPSADEMAQMEEQTQALEETQAQEESSENDVQAQDTEELAPQEVMDTEVEAEPRRSDWQNPMRQRISPVINNEGGVGFHGFASAISPGERMFQVGLLAEASGGSGVIRHNDQNRLFGGNVVVNASILEYFGFHARLQARNNVNSYGRPEAMLSQGDMSLGLLGRYPVQPGIWLGADLSLFVPSSFGGVGLTAAATSIRPRLLASFDFDELAGRQDELVVPVIAHINLGYRFDNSEALVPQGVQLDRIERFAYGISAYDFVELGLGAEFPLPYVTPFLGWSMGIPVNPEGDVCGANRALDCVTSVGASAFPQRLSLGAKTEPLKNLGLHAGIDIGLTGTDAEGLPVTLPYNLIFGLSWNIDTHPVIQIEEREIETIVEVGEPSGHLLGRLLDQSTGEPVTEARVVYVEREDSGHLSHSDTGVFRTYEFEPGESVELEIHHPYYEVGYASWVVEEGSQEQEITLVPLPMEVTLRGQILGPDGDVPEGLSAVVTSSDGTSHELDLDADGRFEQEVRAGLVTVAAFLEGFQTAGRDIELEPNTDDEVEVAIEREESDVVVGLAETDIRVQQRLEYEPGEATLLEESLRVLDVVAAVLFENPQVKKVQVQGHTDDAGDEEYNLQLSQARADAVRSYLIERGVSPNRLEAEGYGSSNPLVPNTSRRNRTLNRRIEFRILD